MEEYGGSTHFKSSPWGRGKQTLGPIEGEGEEVALRRLRSEFCEDTQRREPGLGEKQSMEQINFCIYAVRIWSHRIIES